MGNYDSDFEVRLATLGALGGDTTKHYDSVYSIDLEILNVIEQGGGGEGLNYDQIKALLASSGVTEIVVNGDGDSITLDYDLLSQIGQGGGSGDYTCVDSVAALSGITSPKDGAMAYVKDKGLWKYYASTAITSWLEYEVDLDKLTQDELSNMCEHLISYRNDLSVWIPWTDSNIINKIILSPKLNSNYETRDGNTSIEFRGDVIRKTNYETGIIYIAVRWNPSQQKWYWSGLYGTHFINHNTNDQTYNDVKNKLLNTGVQGIKFVDSGNTGNTIVMDYQLASQIGQGGGGDYICVETIDELSGITSPKDGMMAYVGKHTAQEERLVLSADWYGTEWFSFDMDFGSDVTAKVSLHNSGENINISDGHFLFNNDGWIWGIQNNRSNLPADFVFNNGVTGTLVSNANGAEYAEHNEYLNTIWIDKFNGSFPTVTIEDNGATIVSSGASVQTVTIEYPAKGFWRYYADVQKWLAYDIFIDDITNDELQTVCNDYATYRKPLTANWLKDSNGNAYRKGFAGGVYESNQFMFTTAPDRDYWDNADIFYRHYEKNGETQKWSMNYDGTFRPMSESQVKNTIANKIYTQSSNGDTQVGALYNVAVSGSIEGVIYSTTISTDPTSTDFNEAVHWGNSSSGGRNSYDYIANDGFLRNMWTFGAITGTPEWMVIDYMDYHNDIEGKMKTKLLAVKVVDNGDSTFTISYFVSGTKNEDSKDTNEYTFWTNDDLGYTWTATTNQTLNVTPTLYSVYRMYYRNNTESNPSLYKLL